MTKRPSLLFKSFLQFFILDDDSDDIRITKTIWLVCMCFAIPLCWLMVPVSHAFRWKNFFNYYLLSAIYFSLLFIFFSIRRRGIEWIGLVSQLFLIVISLIVTATGGGLLHSGGVIFMGLIGPLYALAFPKVRRAFYLMAFYLVGVGALAAVQSRLVLMDRIDASANLWLFAITYTVVSLFSFFALMFFVSQRTSTLRRLEKEYRKSEKSILALADSNEQLIKANRLKNDFLGIAAHDLRNPLQMIIGYTELLAKKTAADNPGEKELQRITISAQKMLQLITRLLDTAKQEHTEIHYAQTRLELSALAQDLVESCAPMAARKNQTLKADISGGVQVRGDALLLSQVMENIISNAVKYSHLGRSIFIKLYTDNQKAVFEVLDEGPGLSQEDIHGLFEKFKTLSAIPTAGELSSGLGLSFCKKFIELHGGEMVVRSEPGKGSCFGFSLPVIDD